MTETRQYLANAIAVIFETQVKFTCIVSLFEQPLSSFSWFAYYSLCNDTSVF